MRLMKVAGTGWLVWALAASDAAAQVHFEVQNGRVTIVAQDATVAQILAEWSRAGGTTFVDGDKLDQRVTLELRGVPESAALDLLLRSASGYVVAARSPVGTAGSEYLRVLVVPTSTPPTPQSATVRRPVAAPVAERQPAAEAENIQANEQEQGDILVVGATSAPQPKPTTQAAGVGEVTVPTPSSAQIYPTAGAASGTIGGPGGTAAPGQVTEIPGPPKVIYGRSTSERFVRPGSSPAQNPPPTSTSQTGSETQH